MTHDAEEIKTAMEALFHAVNCMSGEEERIKAVREVFSREHRTLQQSFFREVVIPILHQAADQYKSKDMDLRNEDSCRLANQIVRCVEDEDEVGYPWHLRFV